MVISNNAVISNNSVKQLRHRDFIGGAGVDRLADRPEGLGEVLDPIGVGHVARLEMDLRHPHVISPDEAIEDFRQEPALLAPEPPHDAEIDGDNAARLVDEEISLMHVGVKKPVAQRRAQERLNERARQSARIKSELGQAFGIGKRNPVDPFHRHHFARGAVPIDRRRADFRILLGILGKFRRRRGFEPEVHLDAHRARERLDDLNEAQPSKLRRQAVDEFGGEKHVGQIARKPPFDARAQHFHRHRPHALAGFHVGAVDLGDRSRRDRLAEVLEQGIDLPAERGLDNADRGLAAHRSDTVLQALEIERDLRSDDIGTSSTRIARA